MHHRLLLLGLALALGCGSDSPPNIVLIVVDTLRADRLGDYGNTRNLTPTIDTLARRGTLFQSAYSQSSWTSPSVASLMTSRYQLQHGVLGFTSVLPQAETTVAELLRDHGYATGGFTANAALSSERGFSQGFDEYTRFIRETKGGQILGAYARADQVDSKVLEWLDGLSGATPFFLYIQYMEPHAPYFPSQAALERLRPGRDPINLDRANNLWFLRYGKQPIAPELELVRDLYDAEVIDLDHQLGKLIDELEERGMLDDSILVLTSDHGEEFGDHGSRGHGVTLFEEVVRIPLLIVLPGANSSQRVETTVALVDLPPTLLDLVGVPIPDEFEGHSLRPLLAPTGWLARLREWAFNASDANGSAFQGPGSALVELHRSPFGKEAPRHRQSLIAGNHKAVAGHSGGALEFYDVGTDPLEQNGDALEAGERQILKDRLAAAVRQAAATPAERLEKPLDAKARQNLRALGYIE